MDSVDLVTFLEPIDPPWHGDLLIAPKEVTVCIVSIHGRKTLKRSETFSVSDFSWIDRANNQIYVKKESRKCHTSRKHRDSLCASIAAVIISPSETRYRSSESSENTIWPKVQLSLLQSLQCNTRHNSAGAADESFCIVFVSVVVFLGNFNVQVAAIEVRTSTRGSICLCAWTLPRRINTSELLQGACIISLLFALFLTISFPSPLPSCLLTTTPFCSFSPLRGKSMRWDHVCCLMAAAWGIMGLLLPEGIGM